MTIIDESVGPPIGLAHDSDGDVFARSVSAQRCWLAMPM